MKYELASSWIIFLLGHCGSSFDQSPSPSSISLLTFHFFLSGPTSTTSATPPTWSTAATSSSVANDREEASNRPKLCPGSGSSGSSVLQVTSFCTVKLGFGSTWLLLFKPCKSVACSKMLLYSYVVPASFGFKLGLSRHGSFIYCWVWAIASTSGICQMVIGPWSKTFLLPSVPYNNTIFGKFLA